jgi:hypothetical protein
MPIPGRKISSLLKRPLPPWPIVLTLVLTVLFAYLPVFRLPFAAWDDYENLVQITAYRGFGWASLRWAFTSLHMGVYVPLTWLSYTLDYAIWGLHPSGFHFTNVLLHGANTFLVYRIARFFFKDRADTAFGVELASVATALTFAIHPLRVESVAWVTERRDVLSGFFFLLTLLLYLEKRKGAAAAYAFSLLSKATGVTLPLLLLIIDFYQYLTARQNRRSWRDFPWKQHLRDKTAYFLLAVPFAVLAIYAQHQHAALAPLAFGLRLRAAIAAHSILFYIGKTLWPFHLSPLYPLPDLQTLLVWPSAGYIGIVILISALALRLYRRFPAFLAIWAWYVIALFPVSGFFQSGGQITADRYSYLPSLGLAMGAGAIVLAALRRNISDRALASALGVLFLGLALMTRLQCRVWRDNVTLWSHVVINNPDSVSGRNNLGAALAEQGFLTEAAEQFQIALQLDPQHTGSRRNLAKAQALLRSQKMHASPKIQR